MYIKDEQAFLHVIIKINNCDNNNNNNNGLLLFISIKRTFFKAFKRTLNFLLKRQDFLFFY